MSESIVVGTDGSPTAKLAVAEAVRLASALDAELHVVSAYERHTTVRGTSEGGHAPPARADEAEVEANLSAAAATVRAANVPVTTHAVRREPVDALVEVAGEVGASMIIVGSLGMHGAKRVLGSVPNSVSHKARCNVLIVATDRR
jgi:nucleotide-binding universal stress UspA family protein